MLQATGSNVIVRVIFEKNRGVIVIPEYSPEFKQYYGFVYGVVESIGSKYPYKELKVGDKVIFQRHEGKPIRRDGQLYLKLKEKWAHAVFTE